jgi:hypothetical protein
MLFDKMTGRQNDLEPKFFFFFVSSKQKFDINFDRVEAVMAPVNYLDCYTFQFAEPRGLEI